MFRVRLGGHCREFGSYSTPSPSPGPNPSILNIKPILIISVILNLLALNMGFLLSLVLAHLVLGGLGTGSGYGGQGLRRTLVRPYCCPTITLLAILVYEGKPKVKRHEKVGPSDWRQNFGKGSVSATAGGLGMQRREGRDDHPRDGTAKVTPKPGAASQSKNLFDALRRA